MSKKAKSSRSARDPFLESLIDDVHTAMQRQENDDNQSHRRELIRTLFAAIDGSVWVYRTEVSEIARTCEILTPDEELALSEKFVSVTDQGKITAQQRYVSIMAMIRLTARLATRINRAFQPDFGADGWEKFRRAIKIRNRVTHPKVSSDLLISPEDLSECLGAFYWLLDHCVTGIGQATVGFEHYLADFRQLLDKLKAGDPKALAVYHAVKNTPDDI